jgi:cyclopropane fatty-acyl-phospholipid synthase-like methyltransferase
MPGLDLAFKKSRDERVLEVGCGTGAFTVPLAAAVGRNGHAYLTALCRQTPYRRVQAVNDLLLTRSGVAARSMRVAAGAFEPGTHIPHELMVKVQAEETC